MEHLPNEDSHLLPALVVDGPGGVESQLRTSGRMALLYLACEKDVVGFATDNLRCSCVDEAAVSEVIGEDFFWRGTGGRSNITSSTAAKLGETTPGGSVTSNDEEKVVENRGPMKDVLQVLEERQWTNDAMSQRE